MRGPAVDIRGWLHGRRREERDSEGTVPRERSLEPGKLF
jgi:hypothetical protein